jgi:hypothetical protein
MIRGFIFRVSHGRPTAVLSISANKRGTVCFRC